MSTTTKVLLSGDISINLIFDLASIGSVFVTPFFISKTEILFPIGEIKKSLSSFVKTTLPEL